MDPITGGALVDDTFMTNVPGIFSCGNVLHVHDLVDWVSVESEEVGKCAAMYVQNNRKSSQQQIPIRPGEGVRYVLPQSVSGERDFTLSLRVTAPWRNRTVVVRSGERDVFRKKMMRLHPAEMIRIDIKKENAASGNSMEVSVQ
jgi:hypothetical protein